MKDTMGKMANSKSHSISAIKQGNVKVIRLGHNCPTKQVERSDSGKPRSWIDQARAVEEFVQGRWDGGDPATRQETYGRKPTTCCMFVTIVVKVHPFQQFLCPQ
jgi:hypothetical protein